MSVLFAGLALVCAALLATVTVAASENAALSARARSAADAAALAAVAESAPFGGGRPLEEARRYAAINGGRLVTCRCEPGATVVEVVVEVGAASARARAAFDPAALMPASAPAEGLHPRLQEAVGRLLRAAGDRVRLVSGYRSGEHQTRLWRQALNRYGSADAARKWVAPPGASMHERGLAVDLGGDLELAARLIDRLRLPLHRPLPHEPWHFELEGSRG